MVLILTGLVLMFLLGLYVGANVELRLLMQAKPMPADADAASGSDFDPAGSTYRTDSAASTGPQNGDLTTGQKNSPKSPNDSTKLAA
jgi:hypothetical protein